MRFQDALLLQKKQGEKEERQREAQSRLEEAAVLVDAQFNHWCQFRDPFAESHDRIRQMERLLVGDVEPQPETVAGSSLHSMRRALFNSEPSESSSSGPREVTVRHLDERADVDPTALRLYRRLRFGQ